MSGAGVPGYISPSFALMCQSLQQPAASQGYCITDDWALAIDRAVARLSHRDQQMGDLTWLYFGAKWPMIRVGKYYGVSESKARELVRAGTAWVDCAIEAMRFAA